MDNDTANIFFYYYSSLSQVLGGFIAIIGLFAVYVMQQLNSNIEKKKVTIVEAFHYVNDIPLKNSVPTEYRLNRLKERILSLIKSSEASLKTPGLSSKQMQDGKDTLAKYQEIEGLYADLEISAAVKKIIERETSRIIFYFVYTLLAALTFLAIFKILPLSLNIFLLVCVTGFSFKLFIDAARFIKNYISSII